MPATGQILRRLRDAVLKAVTDQADLERIIQDNLSIRLEDVVPSGPMEKVVADWLNWLSAQGKLLEFTGALRQERAGNNALKSELNTIEQELVSPRSDGDRPEDTSPGNWFLWAGVPAALIAIVIIVLVRVRAQPDPIAPPTHPTTLSSTPSSTAQSSSTAGSASVPVPESNPYVKVLERLKTGYSINKWQAYVSPDNVYSVIEERIGQAQKSILIGVYELTAPHVREMLIAAKQRGVSVTVLLGTPGRRDNADLASELKASGIDVVLARLGRRSIFFSYHPKILVIDDTWTLIQTGNLTSTSVPPTGETKGNRDIGIAVQSAQLAAYFRELLKRDKELLEKDNEGKPDSAGDSDPKYEPYIDIPRVAVLRSESLPSATSSGSAIAQGSLQLVPVLVPENYVDVVTELLTSAQSSVEIVIPYVSVADQAKSPNLHKVLESLTRVRQANQKLRVRIILGRLLAQRSIDRVKESFPWIEQSQIRILNPRSGLNLTNKLILVDRRFCLICSSNWSENGVSRNRDIGALVDSTELSKYFGKVFDIDWEAGLTSVPADPVDDVE